MTERPETAAAGIAEPWDNSDDEYAVLTDLVLPAALERFTSGLSDWNALDSKAMGILALDAGTLGVLVAVHDAVNRFWWLPALGFVVAGVLLIISLWPAGVALGPDLIDLHDKMRGRRPLEAAREMFNDYTEAADANDATAEVKSGWFWWSLPVFLGSLLGCAPIALVHSS